MSRLLACRVCLAHDTRMISIANGPLQDLYETIAIVPLQSDDIMPTCVCYVCHYQMKKIEQFKEKAGKANEMLMQLLNTGIEVSVNNLKMVDKSSGLRWPFGEFLMNVISINPKEIDKEIVLKLEPVKTEMVEENMGDLKPSSDDIYSTQPETAHQDFSSDSEDDIPLLSIKQIKTQPRSKRKNGVQVHVKKERKLLKPDAREIILSKEEQLQQMLERSKSLNYLNSPYKCDLCYKGFVDSRAYENHKEKHDDRSGTFECEICRMRYQTGRHLRTHVVTSHRRRYSCNKCPHLSHTPNQAREHEKWHNGFTYECQLCSEKFGKPTSYLTHMRKRHPTEHICNVCGESFVGKHGLIMHKTKAHKWEENSSSNVDPSSNKYCVECNIQFVTIEAWTKHILNTDRHKQASIARSTCLVCDIELPPDSLASHLQTHRSTLKAPKDLARKLTVVQVPCEQCGANFVNRSKLQAHIKRIHLGLKYNKNIVCEVCGKKCTSNATLKYHQRTHTGEKPYPCALCPKRFADKNQRVIHGRRHTGERPYVCGVCGKRFSQKPALNRHYRVHTGAKPYDCQYCAKTFSQSNSMKLHVNTVHLKLPPNRKKTIDKTAVPELVTSVPV